jgi:hypothetical protein
MRWVVHMLRMGAGTNTQKVLVRKSRGKRSHLPIMRSFVLCPDQRVEHAVALVLSSIS